MAVDVQPGASARASFRQWSTVAVLALLAASAATSRNSINLLAPLIKHDLGLNDTQISVLSGLAFTLFNASVLIPCGWLADRYSRKWVAGLGAVTWSLATILLGFARNFPQLLAGRALIGVAQGALGPTAFSLIRDTLPSRRHGLAFSIYGAAIGVAAVISMLFGGALIGVMGEFETHAVPPLGVFQTWQLIFGLAGLGGVVIAGLAISIREPPRGGAADPPTASSYGTAFKLIRQRWRVFVPLFLFSGLFIATGTSINAWVPSVIFRKFGVPLSHVGLNMGLIMLTLGTPSAVIAGYVVDRLVAKGWKAAPERLAFAISLLTAPLAAAMALVGQVGQFWAVLCAFLFVGGFFQPIGPLVLVRISPPGLGGKIMALYTMTITLIGGVCGPLAVGIVSDRLAGPAGLAVALSVCVTIGALLCCLAAIWLIAELRVLRRDDPQDGGR